MGLIWIHGESWEVREVEMSPGITLLSIHLFKYGKNKAFRSTENCKTCTKITQEGEPHNIIKEKYSVQHDQTEYSVGT